MTQTTAARQDAAGKSTRREKLLLPSLMCADFGHLANEVSELEAAGANGFHLDLMDGQYVPNYGMGIPSISWVAKNAHVPCDVHMMSQNPSRYVDRILDLGVRVVYLHPDTDPGIEATLTHVRERGAHPGIAVNPEVSVAEVRDLLPLVDYVLVMTVHPGFAGQKWIDSVDPKIAELSVLGAQLGFKVVVDGNCSRQNITKALGLGATGFVLGTASLFGHGPYGPTFAELAKL